LGTSTLVGNTTVTGTSTLNNRLTVNGSGSGAAVAVLSAFDTANTDLLVFQRSDAAVRGALSYVSATGAMLFGTTTAHALTIQTNGTQRAQWDSSGNYSLGSSTNITDNPSAASISGGCGTSPSITGKAYAFRVIIGNPAANTCSVGFATSFSNAPSCVVTPQSVATNQAMIVLPSVNSVTISTGDGANFAVAEVLNGMCRGY
jgi:hypothetical protein